MSEARITNLSNESNTSGPTISGITTFSGTHYFVPPVGSTEQRPENPQPGDLRFNTDRGGLEYFRGNTLGWVEVEASSEELNGGTRGIWSGGANWSAASPYNTAVIDAANLTSGGTAIDFGDNTQARRNGGQCGSRIRALLAGGYTTSRVNTIDYITFSSTGDAVDFGDRTTIGTAVAGASSSTRGVWHGANTPTATNIIDYITIASTGNAVDFGDATNTNNNNGSFSSTTRGVFGANGPSGAVDYVTIATTGNAQDFGDFHLGRREVPGSGSNATRGIFAGGEAQPAGAHSNTISYNAIATLGTFQDFGDLLSVRAGMGGAASPTRLAFAGGSNPSNPSGLNTIEYVQIMTTGNSVDFGDLTAVKNSYQGTSNGHGGL